MKCVGWCSLVSCLLAVLLAGCASGTEWCKDDDCSVEEDGDPATDPDGFRVHYFSNWATPFAHFDDGTGWTTLPGKPLTPEGDGWFAYESKVALRGELQIVFNDGADQWDNNGELNYRTALHEFWVKGGRIFDTKPEGGGPVDLCAGVTCGDHGRCDGATGRCACDTGYVLDAATMTCETDLCAAAECAPGELCDDATGACSAACTPDREAGDFSFCIQASGSSLAAVVVYGGAEGLDLARSELRLNDRPLEATEYSYDPAAKRLALSASGLAPSKYSYLLRFTTSSGAPVRPLFLPAWLGEGVRYADFSWRDGIMYQVMTDRFLDGDPGNNLDNNAGTLAQVRDARSTWQGGDFAGITAKIRDGYFTKLGVNALWISSPLLNSHNSQPPVAQSGGQSTERFASYHSYHPVVTGYTHLDDLGYASPIESAFGTAEELHELVREAHLRGIRVVPDFVANHVQKEAALYAAHQDWFFPYNPCDGNWDAHRIDCWFTTDMPDFDFGGHPDAVQAVVDHALWLIEEFNFDGFRADALKHMDDKFVRALKAAVVEQIETTVDDHALPDEATVFYMVGESLGGWARYHTRADMVQGQVDEDYYRRTTGALLSYAESVRNLAEFAIPNDTAYRREADVVVWNGSANVTVGRGGYPGAVMGNFFGNHDQVRALTAAQGHYERLELAQTFLMTSPGNIPMLYQGDDIGTFGGPDPDNRKMQRFDGLSADEQHALEHVRALGTLREKYAPLRRGTRVTKVLEDYFWVYELTYEGESVVVAINRDGEKSYAPPAGFVDGLGECTGGRVPSQRSCVFVPE